MERESNIDYLTNEFESKLRDVCLRYQGMPIALSGGLDSSLLAAFIKPEFAVSVELPGGEKYNEIEHAKIVAKHLGIRHEIVKLNTDKFEDSVRDAVRSIGRPIPHFNIFPLYEMYTQLEIMGVKNLVLGDGPDETMMGYGRDLIFSHLYGTYNYPAFQNYKPLIDKILPSPQESFARMTNLNADEIQKLTEAQPVEKIPSLVDVHLMRKDMDDMSNGIAENFNIKNHRPYQDDMAFDTWMMNLPMEAKIGNVEYGKFVLRKVAERYLPFGIAWRKKKVGGPVFPVNKFMKWEETDGEFGKERWLKYQEELLK